MTENNFVLFISHFEKISRLWPKNFAFRVNWKTELKRFNLITEIVMFSHSTTIIPRQSFRVACEKIGDHLYTTQFKETCSRVGG